jgi:hypothetical protein
MRVPAGEDFSEREQQGKAAIRNLRLRIGSEGALPQWAPDATSPGGRRQARTYLSELEIDVNCVFRLVPSPFTTAMIAREMPAAIRPYSIAVAPLSSEKNFLI